MDPFSLALLPFRCLPAFPIRFARFAVPSSRIAEKETLGDLRNTALRSIF